MNRLASVACLTIVIALASLAHAQDRDKAREAFRRATQHYELGEYREALDAFKEAYRSFEDPALLFNIAQCHRQLGDHAQAVRDYKMYLLKLPDTDNRDDVRELIAQLEKTIRDQQAAKMAPPAGTTAPTPPARLVMMAQQAPPPHPRPLYKRWWLWTAVGGVAAVGLGVGLGVGLSSSSASARTDYGTFRF